jgi:hypothetical protein
MSVRMVEVVFDYIWYSFGDWTAEYVWVYLVLLIYCIRQKLKEED